MERPLSGSVPQSFHGARIVSRTKARVVPESSTRQIGDEPIPLNRGLVFVYHEPIGILASYPNDRYPYGSERNRGSVIAQLVLGDATVLPAQAIDYVLLKNLNLSEGLTSVSPTTTGRPIKTNL